MMLPYGYGKIVNYDRYAADFFGNPICIQLLLGAGKYSLDYFLFSKIKIRISKNETKGILLYLVICGISWFVLANYFTGLVSVCLIVLAITLYLLSLYYIKDNEL